MSKPSILPRPHVGWVLLNSTRDDARWVVLVVGNYEHCEEAVESFCAAHKDAAGCIAVRSRRPQDPGRVLTQ